MVGDGCYLSFDGVRRGIEGAREPHERGWAPLARAAHVVVVVVDVHNRQRLVVDDKSAARAARA